MPAFENLEERRLFSTAYALLGSAGTVLAKFDTATPTDIQSSVIVKGLGRGEKLAGIDFRPATGQLYALGITPTSGDDEGRIYTINPSSGQATEVGNAPFSTSLVASAAYGFDFNPAVDRIRIFNDADQNLRVNPDSGALVQLDTPLDNPVNDEEVTGAAYDRNVNDVMPAGQPAALTTLYGLDFINDTLVRIGGVDGGAPEGSPNLGVVTEIGSLGITESVDAYGFDIGQDGTALAILTDQNDSNTTGLYTIDLTTGAATSVGDLNNGSELVRGFAVAPDDFPPIAKPDAYQVAAGGSLTVNPRGVLLNDIDPDGPDAALTAEKITDPANGTLTFNANGGFTYTPNGGFIGTDSFTYVANDGTSDSTPTTVTLNVVPTVSINDKAITEGNSGTKTLMFTVTLSAPAPVGGASVKFATADNTAGNGSDYVAAAGTITFAAGELSKPVNITIKGDTLVEPDQTFFVKLSNPTNVVIADGQGVGTILNDDVAPPPLPKVSINNESIKEGNSGTSVITFKVTLDKAASQKVTVNFATMNNSAGSNDFIAKSGVVTFGVGETSKMVSITVKGDTTKEGNEIFFVGLSNAINATIGNGKGTGTILNDD